MWMFTKDGFFSTVNYDPKDDRAKDSPFVKFVKKSGTHVLVRTRRREHIEALRKVVKNLIIVEDAGADYKYRAVIPHAKWDKYLLTASAEMDYTSHFKEAVRDAQPEALKKPMYNAMMGVWHDMAVLQPSKPWSNLGPVSGSAGDVSSYVKGKGYKGWTDPTYHTYLADAVKLMGQRGEVTLTSEEVADLTDMAYEFYLRMVETHGKGSEVTVEQIEKVRDEVIQDQDDFYFSGDDLEVEVTDAIVSDDDKEAKK